MAISKELLEQVNYYGKLAKERELTKEEKAQQLKLRAEYLQEFRAGMKQVLDNVDVVKQVTVAKPLEAVESTLKNTPGITEIKQVGFNLTEVTYNVKHHDANSILNKFASN
ncbi:DUF896 domain-containing protein [Mollicutes bacterium LVI A0039]|nr:DUF896 domain-containing protein [Mollicutes bacterium LVI A0039]